MIVGQLVKQPGETFPVTEDFAGDLETGEGIASVEVTAKNYGTLDSSSGTVLTGAPAISTDGTQVSHMVTAGSHGQTHIIQFHVTTDAVPPNEYEHEVEIMVAES